MVVSYGEFKGNKTITLKEKEEDYYGLTFGAKKGMLILQNMEEIKKFVREETGEDCVDADEKYNVKPIENTETKEVTDLNIGENSVDTETVKTEDVVKRGRGRPRKEDVTKEKDEN